MQKLGDNVEYGKKPPGGTFFHRNPKIRIFLVLYVDMNKLRQNYKTNKQHFINVYQLILISCFLYIYQLILISCFFRLKTMSFYNDTSPWTPPNNSYPTWDNMMRYYISRVHSPSLGQGSVSERTIKTSPDQVIHDLALYCITVWESGDGCPKKIKAVKDQFKSEVYPVYQKYRKGDIDKEGFKTKNKKKKKKELTAPPVVCRKSSRGLDTGPSDDGDSEPAAAEVPLKQKVLHQRAPGVRQDLVGTPPGSQTMDTSSLTYFH